MSTNGVYYVAGLPPRQRIVPPPLPDEAVLLEPELNFSHSVRPEPHRDRTKQILRRHPEIRALIGPAPFTFWCILGLVSLQFGVAWFVADRPMWLVLALAYTVGAFASHGLFVMIHECAHRLVFRRRRPNVLAGLVANLPLFVPGSFSFQKYHLKHHSNQGVYELDADIPSEWEARFVGRSTTAEGPVAAALPAVPDRALVPGEGSAAARRVDPHESRHPDRRQPGRLSPVGPEVTGLPGTGALFLHRSAPARGAVDTTALPRGEGEQETFSYYGKLNLVTFNVGYHNEHHDFPSVPWHRLPRIRAAAPEAYEDLTAHTSWTRLLFRFLFDRDITLYSRMTRAHAAGHPVNRVGEGTPSLTGAARAHG